MEGKSGGWGKLKEGNSENVIEREDSVSVYRPVVTYRAFLSSQDSIGKHWLKGLGMGQ